MRRAAAALFIGLLLVTVPAQAASTQHPKAEAKLARLLEGRAAGAPVDCLNLLDIRSSRIMDRTAILYETIGGTLYLNRPEAGRESLNVGDVLVTDTHSHQLCDIDTVRLYDTTIGMQTGVVFLGKFVPYKKRR